MGWNGSGSRADSQVGTKVSIKTPNKRPSVLAYGLFALATLILATVLWIMFSQNPKPSLPEVNPKRKTPLIAEVTPSSAPKAIADTPSNRMSKAFAEKRKILDSMTPKELHERQLEIMKEREIDLTPTTNKPFRTGIEWQMARLFTTPLGRRPVPLPPAIHVKDEAHMMEILSTANPALEGDSEQVKIMKKAVEAAKEELKNYIKEGGDYDGFMQYYHSKLMDAFTLRQEYVKQVLQVSKEDPSISKDFFDEANAKLAEKGIEPIKFTNWKMKKLGLDGSQGGQ